MGFFLFSARLIRGFLAYQYFHSKYPFPLTDFYTLTL